MVIDRNTTVAEVARDSALLAILREQGIDLCCGGELTLEQAATIKGIAVDELLAKLSPPSPPSERRVRGEDSIRDVLAKYPWLGPILDRHGLGGCGGKRGPDEPLAVFANVHRVPLEPLLEELEAAANKAPPRRLAVVDSGGTSSEKSSRSESAKNESGKKPKDIYRRFLVTAIIATLTFGATFGAYNLIVFHLGVGGGSPAHNWSHANFQVMGFVLLFTMGVAYHALPRFLNVQLALERLARASFGCALAGLLMRSWGHMAPVVPGSLNALVAGSVLQLAAVVLFAIVLAVTWKRAQAPREDFHIFLVAGTVSWVIAVVPLVLGAIQANLEDDVAFASRWHEAHYHAALLGGAVLWIEGMFLRTGALFLQLRPARRKTILASLVLGTLGALVATAGALLGGAKGALVRDAGLMATAIGFVAYVVGVRIFEPCGAPASEAVLARRLRLAFAWGVGFAGLALPYAAAGLLGKRLPSLVHDGARHALGLGFVTLAILAMGSRIVPVFAGARTRWPHLQTAGTWLLLLGLVLRETQVVLALGGPNELLYLSGSSGIFSALGVGLASTSLLATMLAKESSEEERNVPIALEARVAGLVASHPEALPILIEAGFTPLANPILRRTLGRAITLGDACRLNRIEPAPLLERLRKACPHGAKA